MLIPDISGSIFYLLTELLVGTNTIICSVTSVELSEVLAIISWAHRIADIFTC